jgi:hypothetical protein
VSNNIENIKDYQKGKGLITGNFLLYGGSNITCVSSSLSSRLSFSIPNLIEEKDFIAPPISPPVYNIYGCTDPTATNYNPQASVDDGSCVYLGCTDPSALNYNPVANIDDGSCCYISGCTNPNALNYNPSACHDDGSCCYISGCTNPNALNYNPSACYDDGSCIAKVYGCTDPAATNYNPAANVDNGSCTYAPFIGKTGAYIGFTGATGAYDEYLMVHNLKFQNPYTLLDYSNGFDNNFSYNGTAYLDINGNSKGCPAIILI